MKRKIPLILIGKSAIPEIEEPDRPKKKKQEGNAYETRWDSCCWIVDFTHRYRLDTDDELRAGDG